MAVRWDGRDIYLNVRDLLPPADYERLAANIPLPQRGKMGREAQSYLQNNRRIQKSLFIAECVVNHSYPYRDVTFHVSGRIDGVYKMPQRLELEEIKSVMMNAGAFRTVRPEALPHFTTQALIYAYLLQDSNQGVEVIPYLRLFNLINDKEKRFRLKYNRQTVERMIIARFESLYTAGEKEARRNVVRQSALRDLHFDLPEQRPGQKMMMDAAAQALLQKEHLLVSAPTGTGKTAGALIPFLKHAATHGLKIFFATSRTSQQEHVLNTLRRIDPHETVFRYFTVGAAGRLCANPVFFCHESFCPYIDTFAQRLDQSRLTEQLLARKGLTRDDLYQAAVEKRLCPVEVQNKLLRHYDVLIGDINYVFDPMASRKNLFGREGFDKWLLIVDEAHGLPDRGRDYLSVTLSRHTLESLGFELAAEKSKVYDGLRAALDLWYKWFDAREEEGRVHYTDREAYAFDPPVKELTEMARVFEAAYIAYLMHKVRRNIIRPNDPVEALYYLFRRITFSLRQEEVPLKGLFSARDGGTFRLVCPDASGYLRNRLERFTTVLAMSATLDPLDYYQNMLGFPPDNTRRLFVPSPFPSDHKKVVIVPHISTRYKDRHKTWPLVAEVIRETIAVKPGNYLVFFPGFDYLQNVSLFLGNCPVEIIRQRPEMQEEERREILAIIKKKETPVALLAVLGGIFAEGIDFSGDMAIGVIIVGPGLPPHTHERELMRAHFENVHGDGDAYAYRYPAGQKIIQAAGRLIRTQQDTGVIVLIGERFAEEKYQELLPDYWLEKPGDVEITADYRAALLDFWQGLERKNRKGHPSS